MGNDTDIQHYTLKAKAGRILFLFAFAFLIITCTPNNPEEIKALTDSQEFPHVYFKELNAFATDSGRLKYRLIAQEIFQYENAEEPTIDFPQGLHYYIYENEEIETQIKCKFAIYFQKTEIWELRKEVEISNASGSVINTELLYWDTNNNRIYSDEFVTITTQNEVLTGYGFETDEQISVYSINNASGTFTVEDSEDYIN